jgi:hypothetical protein
VIRSMCEVMRPTPQDRICDPAAGTGGFLCNGPRQGCCCLQRDGDAVQPAEIRFHLRQESGRDSTALIFRQNGHPPDVSFTIRNSEGDRSNYAICCLDRHKNSHFRLTALQRCRREHGIGECQVRVTLAVWFESLSQTIQDSLRIARCRFTNRKPLLHIQLFACPPIGEIRFELGRCSWRHQSAASIAIAWPTSSSLAATTDLAASRPRR